jgi:hypothetical protein
VYASQPPSPATTQHSLEGGSLLPYPHRSFTGWTAPASPGALTVDILTGFYARYRGLPSRFRNGPAAGQQTGRLSAPPGPPSVAISVGTTPMIAIPVAAFMGPVAMIVGPAPQIRCNDFGHGRPMIAIPAADDCGSLHIAAAGIKGEPKSPLFRASSGKTKIMSDRPLDRKDAFAMVQRLG